MISMIGYIIALVSCYLTRKSLNITKQQFEFVSEDRESQKLFLKITRIKLFFFEKIFLCSKQIIESVFRNNIFELPLKITKEELEKIQLDVMHKIITYLSDKKLNYNDMIKKLKNDLINYTFLIDYNIKLFKKEFPLLKDVEEHIKGTIDSFFYPINKDFEKLYRIKKTPYFQSLGQGETSFQSLEDFNKKIITINENYKQTINYTIVLNDYCRNFNKKEIDELYKLIHNNDYL